jgi:hypothetical protein
MADKQPMSTFDPSRLCMVHDQLNGSWDSSNPEDASRYRQYAEPQDSLTPQVIHFDGRLLDGWREV